MPSNQADCRSWRGRPGTNTPARIAQRRHKQVDPHALAGDRHPRLAEVDLQLMTGRRLEAQRRPRLGPQRLAQSRHRPLDRAQAHRQPSLAQQILAHDSRRCLDAAGTVQPTSPQAPPVAWGAAAAGSRPIPRPPDTAAPSAGCTPTPVQSAVPPAQRSSAAASPRPRPACASRSPAAARSRAETSDEFWSSRAPPPRPWRWCSFTCRRRCSFSCRPTAESLGTYTSIPSQGAGLAPPPVRGRTTERAQHSNGPMREGQPSRHSPGVFSQGNCRW